MASRIFSREFKVEAVRLVQERGVSIAQASRDLDLNDNVLRRWIREMSSDPSQASPGRGQIKASTTVWDQPRYGCGRQHERADCLSRASNWGALPCRLLKASCQGDCEKTEK